MGLVAYPHDQSVFVIPDVENRAVVVNVRAAECRKHVCKSLPVRVGCDVIPGIERDPALGVKFVELPDPSVRYNAYSLPPNVQILFCLSAPP
jgi:hypothetical protein